MAAAGFSAATASMPATPTTSSLPLASASAASGSALALAPASADPILVPVPTTDRLESCLAAVEAHLAALGSALRARDAAGIEMHAAELHGALATAIRQFADAARSGPLPAALRSRLAQASGQVAAQRESLARATAALDRAIDALLPRDAAPLYSAFGNTERGMFQSGFARA